MSLRRLLGRSRLAALVVVLAATTAGTAVATSHIRASDPVAIQVDESIASSDAAGAVPPTAAAADEGVHVGDSATVLGPLSITVEESIAAGDSAGAVPPVGAAVDEAVHVFDAASVVGPVSVSDGESITVGDGVLVLPAPKVESGESVSVTDQVSVEVLAAPTQVTLASSVPATLLGTAATVGAHVTAGTQDVASGSVTLQEGGTVLAGPVVLDASGRAELTTSALTLGAHSLDVIYSGAAGFTGSSATISHGVYDYAVTVAPADRTVLRGGSTSYDATVMLTPGSVTSGLSPTLSLGVGGAPADATIILPATIALPSVAGTPVTATVGVTTGAYSLGDYPLVVTAGARSAVARLHIYDYSLALSPPSATVQRGGVALYTLTAGLVPASSTIGLPTQLALVTSAPAGISPTVDAVNLPGQAAVSVRASATAPTGVSSFTVRSADGARSATAEIFVNVAPEPSVGGPYTVNEGSSVVVTATMTDADHDTLTAAWDLNGDGTFETPGLTASFLGIDGPATAHPVFRACDNHDACATATATVTVRNVAPTARITAPADGATITAGTPVIFTGSFTDPGTLDTQTARWSFGATGFSATNTFAAAGFPTVTLTVTDKDGGVGTASIGLIVVNPSAGFVTGGGWIALPSGKANFGFNARYNGATPTGDTEFQAPGVNFHSTSYRFLVVVGSSIEVAGAGTLNGTAGYSFQVSAVEGSPDKLRMHIWQTLHPSVGYDTGPLKALGGGQIKIHR